MDARTLRAIDEAYLEQQVLGEATEAGWMAHHIRDSRRVLMGQAGFPDWSFAKGGRLVIAELKRETEKPSAHQLEWLLALGWRGDAEQWLQDPSGPLQVYVWRPSDWDDRSIRQVFQGEQ